MANNIQILVYITDNKERVISGDALTLYITDEEERQQLITDLERMLKANVVQLKNGDHILINS